MSVAQNGNAAARGLHRLHPHELRDSGVPWLGSIPTHWEVWKLGHLLRLASGETLSGECISGHGPFPVYGGNGLRGYFTEASHHGDYVLIGRQGALCGNINYAHGEFWATEHALVVYPQRNLNLRWLGESLRNMNLNQYSVAAAQPGLSVPNITCLRFAVPPLEEQTQIAKFLDYETAKIDALIEKQQQLIALLKEKRQAVISHAVTKGLHPAAPMKDSGVEWLGKVPAHWEVLKGSWLGQLFGSESVPEDHVMEEGPLLFIKVSSLSLDGFFLSEGRFFVSPRYASAVTARSGFLVFPKRGAAIFTNKVNIVSERAVIDPNLMGWIPNGRAAAKYLAHVLKLRGLGDIADVSTVPQINNKHIAPMMFPVPPKYEQAEILQHLEGLLSKLDQLTHKANTQITLLQERRTALISAAVTGKIDVRGWKPPRSEEQVA